MQCNECPERKFESDKSVKLHVINAHKLPEAKRLHEAGKTYEEIARELSERYGQTNTSTIHGWINGRTPKRKSEIVTPSPKAAIPVIVRYCSSCGERIPNAYIVR